jgi:hypothetical protein
MIQIYHLWWINLNLGDQESALNHKADLCASQCWFMWFMQQTIGVQEQHGTRMAAQTICGRQKTIHHFRMQGCFFWGVVPSFAASF